MHNSIDGKPLVNFLYVCCTKFDYVHVQENAYTC